MTGETYFTKTSCLLRSFMYISVYHLYCKLSKMRFAAWLGKNNDAMGHEFVTWTTVMMMSLVSALNPFLFNLSWFFDYMVNAQICRSMTKTSKSHVHKQPQNIHCPHEVALRYQRSKERHSCAA